MENIDKSRISEKAMIVQSNNSILEANYSDVMKARDTKKAWTHGQSKKKKNSSKQQKSIMKQQHRETRRNAEQITEVARN